MTGVGFSSVVTGLLELSVPTYAFRLTRRFGTKRVGWFIVTAFASMALLHLLGPTRVAGSGPAAMILTDLSYAVGSVLLLLGMCHVETLFRERERARWREESLRGEWDLRAKEETAHLFRSNRDLIQEIAQRDQLVADLKQSEARYQQLFDDNPQPMWIVDVGTAQFLAVNNAALRQYGFTAEEFSGLTGRDLVLPTAAGEFLKDLERPCPAVESRGVWQHCRKDGNLIDVELTAIDLRFAGRSARLLVSTDITQRRRRELEVRKALKMDTIGQVAGGIAHHFNNILSTIECHTTAVLDKPLDLKSAEDLEHISAAVTRAAVLTRQLLMAGGRHLMRLESLDLNGLIRSLNPLLSRLAGEQVHLDHNFSFLPPVQADRHLVEHVLVNLVLNAREAMPNGGTLTFSTAKVYVDEGQIETGHPDRRGHYVRLSVRDTGCGISPQLQARLFEPFFTTREAGQGVGLGLASVYGAVRQQLGWIEVISDEGAGADFRIFLPCVTASTSNDSTDTKVIAQTKGTILLVETDDRVRALARFVLNREGYRVIEADGAATALVLWQGQGVDVDLLLTDPNLPGGLSGLGLASQLRLLKPGLRILYATGNSPEEQREFAGSLDGGNSILKPYNPETLLQAVRGSLGS